MQRVLTHLQEAHKIARKEGQEFLTFIIEMAENECKASLNKKDEEVLVDLAQYRQQALRDNQL